MSAGNLEINSPSDDKAIVDNVPSSRANKQPSPGLITCKLEINSLNGEKTIIDNVSVTGTCIGDVYDMVQDIEEPAREFRLMAVLNGRLVPMRHGERERTLFALGFQGNEQYRIEVCMAWHELKTVLYGS
jgi:hypothetical protein